MSRAAFTELSKTKGTVINISATLHYTSTPWQTHASAAKAGVDSLTRSMASEWGNFGIRVVGIAPGNPYFIFMITIQKVQLRTLKVLQDLD